MASRLVFPIFKEDATGGITLDKTVDVADLSVEKNGTPISPTIYNNGDGMYYFEITESAKYTVLLNGIEQDELYDVFVPTDDVLSDANLDGSPALGQIQKDGSDYLEVYAGGSTLLIVTDIINDLTTGGAAVPLSAEQGKHLEDNKIEIADIVNNVASSDTDKPLSAAQGKFLYDSMELDFADPTYIDDRKSLSQNFERLDNAVVALALASGLTSYRQIYAATLEAAVTDDSEVGSVAEWTEDTQAQAKIKIYLPYVKKPTDTKLTLTCIAKTTSVVGDDYGYIVLEDGDGNDYENITVLSSETSMVEKTVDLDISGLSDGIRYVLVRMGINGSAGSVQMSNPTIEVQTG